jgi:hypothetical protein
MMVQSVQTTLLLAYVPTGRTHACAGGANDALTAHEIPWGTNEIRTAQVTIVIVYDLTRRPARALSSACSARSSADGTGVPSANSA